MIQLGQKRPPSQSSTDDPITLTPKWPFGGEFWGGGQIACDKNFCQIFFFLSFSANKFNIFYDYLIPNNTKILNNFVLARLKILPIAFASFAGIFFNFDCEF